MVAFYKATRPCAVFFLPDLIATPDGTVNPRSGRLRYPLNIEPLHVQVILHPDRTKLFFIPLPDTHPHTYVTHTHMLYIYICSCFVFFPRLQCLFFLYTDPIAYIHEQQTKTCCMHFIFMLKVLDSPMEC